MHSIQQIQDQIIDEFNFFKDWSEKYQYLIDLGKNLPEFNDSNRIDSNLIKGCQSKVWLNSSFDNNVVIFEADSDAIISKGIISLLIRVFSGHKPEDILESKIDFIPNLERFDPPTDKYSISLFFSLSFEITVDANLSPEGSPVNINIFFILL